MEHHLRIAEYLSDLLDNKFSIFGVRFGIDPILGLFEGVGDIITVIVGLYFIWIARQLDVSKSDIGRMISNVMIDFLIGIIPVFGDLFDFAFKSHVKNLEILRAYAPSDDMKQPLDGVRTTGEGDRIT